MEGQIAWWDWLGIGMGIVGVVAFLMAVQPFIQFWFGRPSLKMIFQDAVTDQGLRGVKVLIHNEPVTNRILRWAKVHREDVKSEVMIFSIRDKDTQKRVVVMAQPTIITSAEKGFHPDSTNASSLTTLPASNLPVASIILVGEGKNEQGEKYVFALEENKTVLDPGLYELTFKVIASEITASATCTIWVDNDNTLILTQLRN